jgi:DDE family transposase
MPSRSHHTRSARQPQLAPASLDLWASEVVPHLPADLEQQARILGAFQRRRALKCATDLLRAVLASVLIATSLQHLGAWAVLAGVADISAPAWHKRLINCIPFLEWLLVELLSPALPVLRIFPHADGNILLVDATRLRQVGGCGDDWRLHTAYNFTAGRLAQVKLTDQSGGEHLGYYQLKIGDIVVADGGYGYRRSVATVSKQQAHLLIRIRPSTFPFEQQSGQVLDVVAQLRKRGPALREWAGWCSDGDGERYRVRLIAAKLPAREAAAARRRARQNALDHGRKVQPNTLLLAGWVLLVTTLPARRWQASDLLRLYRVRWQIEMVFKRLKSILHVAQLRAVSPEGVEASVLALLLAWVLQENQAALLRQQLKQLGQAEEQIVSSWSLTVLSVDVVRQQVRGDWGQARLQSCLGQLERFLTSRVRQQRQHQESSMRAWLERMPRPNLVLEQAA